MAWAGAAWTTRPVGAATGEFETGVVQDLPEGLAVSDMTQGFGKLPVAFNWSGAQMALVSAHKLGGPKGVGALVMRRAPIWRRRSAAAGRKWAAARAPRT